MGVTLISASDARFLIYAESPMPDSTVQAGSNSCGGLRGKLIVSVPLQTVHGLPVISVRAKNHKAAIFLLDSGSEKSFLNAVDVVRLGFKLVPIARKIEIRGVSAVSETSSEAKAVELFVGEKYRIHGNVLTMDLTEFSRLAGVELSGVIGYDILRTLPMALDYKNGRFLIYKRIILPDEDIFASEKIDLSKSLPVVASSLVIAGKIQGDVKYAIDTGSDKGALIGWKYSESHDLTKIDGWKRSGSLGFNGSLIGLSGLPGEVVFGGQSIHINSVALSARGAPALSGYDLSVGNPAFADRCLLFDAPKGRVYLSKAPPDTGEVVSRDGLQ